MLRLIAAGGASALLVFAGAARPAGERSVSRGEPWAGSLAGGVLLPAGGSAHFTWDPVLKRSPNRAWRRWGSDRLVDTLRRVLADFGRQYPWAPPVGVGDLSRRRGGDFGARFGYPGHVSHQNGLDADVYYPRRDRRLRPPVRPSQIDRRLAQALVDRFVRGGAVKVFVGPNTGLRGPRGVVSVLPTWHDNHMHVRLPPRRCPTTFVNEARGHSLRLPCGWHARVSPRSGTTEISTAPLRGAFDVASFRAPERGVRLWLFDYGRPRVPGNSTTRAALRLSGPDLFEGFGAVRTALFRVNRHAFQAWVKLDPRAPARLRLRTEALLRSVRLTPRGRRLALEIESRVIGRTSGGRPLRAWRVGNPRGRPRVLVVGCIHGNECAGTAVTLRLVNGVGPLTGEVWVVQNLNPDGLARRTRWNGRGVDLNRNFAAGWRRRARHGGRPFSEPEARVARDLIRRIRPATTLWFHQPQGGVRAWGRSVPAARAYARAVRLPFRALRWLPGSAPQWQNRRLRRTSFVVELPPGPMTGAAADRHVRAILRLVR